jgi:multidrug efflux pump
MLGETTLAMLYVPLLFYLFDRLKEGRDKSQPVPPAAGADAGNAVQPEAD